MIKCQELTDPKSCMSRAADDEMTFVLLARDVAAPHTIREWAFQRVSLGKNMPEDAQIVEALAVAEAMEQNHDPARTRGNSFSMNTAIRATFPDPDEAAAYMEVEFLSPATPNDTMRQIRARMRRFQLETINALADRLVDAAARLESTNNTVTFQDLRREAQALRDYAETLAPPSATEEATR